MGKEEQVFAITIAVMLAQCFSEGDGQELEAKVAGAKLPTPLFRHSAVYDGNDSVYIFGGFNVITRDILRYSISNDQIVKVSSMMTDSGGGLAVQGSDSKYIYYFGGTSADYLVQRFNTETSETRLLSAELPSPILHASGLSNKDGSILIYNGRYTRDIIQFEEASETATVIGDLPFQNDESLIFSAAAILSGKENGSVWIFAGNNPKPTNPILLFNTATKTVSIPTGNATSQFPTLYETPATVTNGRDGFIIGGFGRVAESDGSYHPTNGILKVNLDDPSVTEFLPVASYPSWDGQILDSTAAVYVEKLNRIYIFGGVIMTKANGNYRFLDSIWHIELPSLPPVPAFNCTGLAQGSYPHPTECASFFICLDGELAGEFKCSSTDLFDPIQQTCSIPELVICFFSCEGQEGLHPHPNDCSKFIVCQEGLSQIEVFDCPEPLLFDPVLLKCNLPQFVECS